MADIDTSKIESLLEEILRDLNNKSDEIESLLESINEKIEDIEERLVPNT